MKSHYSNTKLSLYFSSFLMLATFVSCGTAQTITGSDDGIYADEEQPQRKVVVTDDKEYKDYNDNYFRRELQILDGIKGTDVLTEIDDYSSDDYDYDSERILEEDGERQITFNEPWGYDNNNSDVVVNINTFGNYGYGFNNWGFYNGWDPYWGNAWGFNNWGWNRWGWRGRWGNRWGFNQFWHPYHSPYYWNNGFYAGVGFNSPYYCSPYNRGFYNRGFYNNRYYRGYNTLRRASRRAVASNSRYARNSSRRTYNTSRRSSTYRKGQSSNTGRATRSSRSSNYNKSRRSTRSSSNTKARTRSTTPSTRRSTSPSRSSRSYSPSRSSSSRSYSRGSGSSSRSYSRGSSSRSSSSRGSSRSRR